jgi:hypothetical protein
MPDEPRHCVYCGDWFECRDHRVPNDWLGYNRSYATGDVVAACCECNLLLSNIAKVTLLSRAEYLIEAYEKRAAKWFRVPPWSEQELREMGYNMQTHIHRALMLRSIYIGKLRNLDLTGLGYDPIPIPYDDHSGWIVKARGDLSKPRNGPFG